MFGRDAWIEIRRAGEEGICGEELRIGVREKIRTAEAQVRKVVDVLDGMFFRVAGVRGSRGNNKIVDDVAVVGIVDGDGSVGPVGKVEDILVAGVVDKPEVRHRVGFQAATAVSIDNIADDESRRRVGGAVVVSAIA